MAMRIKGVVFELYLTNLSAFFLEEDKKLVIIIHKLSGFFGEMTSKQREFTVFFGGGCTDLL